MRNMFFRKPLAVLVTCMDGRLLPSRIFKAERGELLIIRNPGNFVPHSCKCEPSEGSEAPAFPSGELAGLQLAIQKMAIPDVIVCGHTDCRAGEALRHLPVSRPTGQTGSGSQHSMDLMNNWLRAYGSPALEKYERHMENPAEEVTYEGGGRKGAKLSAVIEDNGKLSKTDRLAQINVLQQLEHLQSYDFIGKRMETDQIRLHATFYDTFSGNVYVFNQKQGRFNFLPTADIDSLSHYIFQLRSS
ncbi:beta carbonic anhydrase 1 isoform X2 [Strongylocentrotus purpuratus]|uniref:Carbonic anhydrase n=1 Tax=Strongylocentrotus purpuratus TaxID=7668 RepID=A0A7M7GHP8_STRPU|nr:beta carbonic anhydrase 1 isoform X2 [Strongylocentrotus purpuratus]|eukprot:XP_003724797.1 PREDICTED: beta carbonic anhydrase 1 isoform X2 [Strongylocentrotus purpuratus]